MCEALALRIVVLALRSVHFLKVAWHNVDLGLVVSQTYLTINKANPTKQKELQSQFNNLEDHEKKIKKKKKNNNNNNNNNNDNNKNL